MSVAEYKQSQTAVGPMPVVDIDFTSAIPLYERQYEYPYKLMLLGLHTLQMIVVGTETLAKASPPSRLRHQCGAGGPYRRYVNSNFYLFKFIANSLPFSCTNCSSFQTTDFSDTRKLIKKKVILYTEET